MIDIGVILSNGSTDQTLQLRVEETTGADVLYALVAERLGLSGGFVLQTGRDGRLLGIEGTIAELRLVHGEELLLVQGHEPPRRNEGTGLRVLVMKGPHAGEVFKTSASTLAVGRAAPVGQVRLNRDDALSRLHLEVQALGAARVLVTDLGSTNGVFLNGGRIEGSVEAGPDDDIELGASTVRVHGARYDPYSHGHLRYEAGRLAFNRTPRMRIRPSSAPVVFPAPPLRAPKRRLNPIIAGLPLISGLVLFALTRNPLTLLMVAVAPLMTVASYLDDVVGARRDFTQKAEAYHEELRLLAEQVGHTRDRCHSYRMTTWPRTEQLIAQTLAHSSDLWPRDPADDDFLDLRIGTCAQPSWVGVTPPEAGDDLLRREAEATANDLAIEEDAPLVVSLGHHAQRPTGQSAANFVGIVGDPATVTAIGRALVVQLSTLHSPQDVAVAVLAPGAEDDWSWVRWLPHASSLVDKCDHTMVALDHAAACGVFDEILTLARIRQSVSAERVRSNRAGQAHLCVIAQPPVQITESSLSAFIDTLKDANMSLIWLTGDRRQLHRRCTVVVEASSPGPALVHFTADGLTFDDVVVEQVTVVEATHAAHGLAPLVDVTATSATGSIPARVNLLDQLGLADLDEAAIEARWLDNSSRGGLQAVVGADERGPFSLPLRHHAIVGGTTGSGKSELVQSWVASLALTYSPERLNFVFVDFKGGLGVRECRYLPHAVGLVTNLDDHLAERVMCSLQAESDRRARVLAQHGVSNLEDLLAKAPDAAPANLVIVFDEFKEAVDKVPPSPDGTTFIARVKSLAALGRAYGIHLLLATQTPEGVITDDLKNNVEHRVALRVKSAEISRTIIGRPDAALIPSRTPGRAFVEIETGLVREFQGAYVGGQSTTANGTNRHVATLEPYGHTNASKSAERSAPNDPLQLCDLQRIVVATTALAARRAKPLPYRPWHPELGAAISLESVLGAIEDAEADQDFAIPLGWSDKPALQTQEPFWFDLGQFGSAAIFGGVGAGKSTALRTLAAAMSYRYRPDEAQLYVIDMTGTELAGLSELPHTVAVVNGREVDRLRQLASRLNSLIDRRRESAAESGVNAVQLPRIVLLIDGFAALHDLTEQSPADPLGEQFGRLITDGRAVGLFVVATVNRTTNLPFGVLKSIPGRLVLRMNNPDDYASGLLNLARLSRMTRSPEGRCYTPEGLEVQLAIAQPPGTKPGCGPLDANAQNQAIAAMAAHCSRRWPGVSAPSLRALPRQFSREALSRPGLGARQFAFALDEVDVAEVLVDFARSATFAVTGPEQSGRSTTLSVILTQFRFAWPDAEAFLLSSRRQPPTRAGCPVEAAFGDRAASELLDALQPRFATRRSSGWDQPMLVLVDDADPWSTGPLADRLNQVVGHARDSGIWLVIALSSHAATKSFAPWWKAVQANRQGLQLMAEAGELPALDKPLPRRVRLESLPGRGFHLERSRYQIIQVAS